METVICHALQEALTKAKGSLFIFCIEQSESAITETRSCLIYCFCNHQDEKRDTAVQIIRRTTTPHHHNRRAARSRSKPLFRPREKQLDTALFFIPIMTTFHCFCHTLCNVGRSIASSTTWTNMTSIPLRMRFDKAANNYRNPQGIGYCFCCACDDDEEWTSGSGC